MHGCCVFSCNCLLSRCWFSRCWAEIWKVVFVEKNATNCGYLQIKNQKKSHQIHYELSWGFVYKKNIILYIKWIFSLNILIYTLFTNGHFFLNWLCWEIQILSIFACSIFNSVTEEQSRTMSYIKISDGSVLFISLPLVCERKHHFPKTVRRFWHYSEMKEWTQDFHAVARCFSLTVEP